MKFNCELTSISGKSTGTRCMLCLDGWPLPGVLSPQ